MGILSSLFGKQKQMDATSVTGNESIHVTAQINHKLMPIDRGDYYEDPIDEVLRGKGFGEACGGGTMQAEYGGIDFIDVEMDLTDIENGVPFVISKLEEFGAPKGSILRVHDSEPAREIPFGKIEGVGVYLDGTSLSDEVYKNSDINVVVEELNKAIAGNGELQSHWEGNTETALYFYGDNAEQMIKSMRDFLDTYPLCEGSRSVIIAPK
ncbi:MAG: hypothetical protein ACSHX6_16680 [Akkermansiaceae bacterium]